MEGKSVPKNKNIILLIKCKENDFVSYCPTSYLTKIFKGKKKAQT